MKTESETYVVVEHAGQDNERTVRGNFGSYEAASRWCSHTYGCEQAEELGVDIMKRLPSGELTTEF